MHRIKPILLSGYFLALVIAIPIAISIRGIHKKYTAKTELLETYDKAHYVQFYDLDGDGESEKIVLLDNQKGNGCLKIYNPAFVGQFNAQSSPVFPNCLSIDDYDSNGIAEVYFLGLRNDSVFINQLIYGNDVIQSFLFETIQPNTDIRGSTGKLYDLNNDGYKELILEMNAGYALVPRKIYALDLRTKKIMHTPLVGAKVGPQHYFDLDKDGNMDIICACPSPKNYGSRPVPYSDIYSWLMVFDHHLNFLFEPIQVSDKNVTSHVHPFTMNGENYLLGTFMLRKNLSSPLHYYIVNAQGEIIDSDSIKYTSHKRFDYLSENLFSFSKKNIPVAYIDFEGDLFKLNNKFKFVKHHKINNLEYSYFRKELDINGDGSKEYIFKPNRQNRYIIFDQTFKHRVELDFTNDPNMQDVFSIRHRKGHKPTLIIQKGFNIYEITYRKNIFWQWRYLIYLLIYAAALGFIHVIRYSQRVQLKRQFEAQQNIRELQFKLVTAQLNPHFTFNALNSISKEVYNPDKPEVYDLLTSFSRLIRTTLTDTDKVARPLKDELKLTADFVKIQQKRFDHSFIYEVDLSDSVNDYIMVPKMIIQLFVENAIKHGFPHVAGQDAIKVFMQQIQGALKIEIVDNGMGREVTLKRKKDSHNGSTGIGIKVMTEFIQLLNKTNAHKITIHIIDRLKKEDKQGTRIVISIPEGYVYS